MQNTQASRVDYLVNAVWQFMNICRGSLSVNDMLIPILTILYAIHKGYRIETSGYSRFFVPVDEDNLLHDLYKEIPINENIQKIICKFISETEHIGHDVIRSEYVNIIRRLFDMVSSHADRTTGEFCTPAELNKLIAYYIKKEDCHLVYDPFCGSASIVYDLDKNVRFEGQEINSKTALFARLNCEAAYGTDANITVGDSIENWNNSIADAVVSCPPLGLRLTKEQLWTIRYKNHNEFDCRSFEEIFQMQSFNVSCAGLSIMLLPTGFCFRGSVDYEVRKLLIELNLVDTIVALPANILYGTSVPSILLVCRKFREKNEPITIIHAENYFVGERRNRVFDFDRFIKMIEGDACDATKILPEEFIKYDYNFTPSLYKKHNFELKDGQQVVNLGDLISIVEGERIQSSDISEMVLPRNFGNDIAKILVNNGKLSVPSNTRRNVACRLMKASSNKYLMASFLLNECQYGINTDGNDFIYPADIKVFKVNDSLVIPEYLAYILVNNKAISTGRMPLTNYLMFPVVIDSIENQKKLVSYIIHQYEQQINAEREADAKRLGIKQNVSDLEHMLGSTQIRINKIISRLEAATPSSENYAHLVKSLKDNVEYMNRIIKYDNAQISSEFFNMKDDDIVQFIQDYAKGWDNYGGGYFELNVINELDSSLKIKFDRAMLTVMLDSILNNAVRHGFHKRKDFTERNLVQIRVSATEYKNSPYVLLAVANNGEPIAEGFTIVDYTSRGRFSANTGRSGLGGYHIHQIVKGHNGFLCLDSNKMWNMIVDVLLPIDSTETDNMPAYDNECI